jgi:hypothetical protein
MFKSRPYSSHRAYKASANMNWVLIVKFCELTGYTEDAVRCKIKDGIWQENLHWQKAANRIHMSMRGYEQWVTNKGKTNGGKLTPVQ